MDKKPLVQLKNLTKLFPIGRRTLHAVNDISFSIYPNEILGLAGESGCGKSTVGKLITGLLAPTQGQVLYEGRCLHSFSRNEMRSLRKEIQIIFQNPSTSLNPRMTVAEIMAEPFEIHQHAFGEQRRKQILELFDRVSLSRDLLGRMPHELSGGQKQRVNIARALALKPRFLVCDEPLSSLDLMVQSQVVELLQSLHKEMELTMLFISHDLTLMRYLTNRMAVMYLGNLVELAPTDTLFQNPNHPYTKMLLSAISNRQQPQSLPLLSQGEMASPFVEMVGCSFQSRCPYVTPVCSATKPELQERLPEQFSACHLMDIRGHSWTSLDTHGQNFTTSMDVHGCP